MIERHFEVPFVSRLALREKQIQQNYRPVIAVHKWFARRPGTLFRSLLLAEFLERPVHQTFYQSQKLPFVRVFDPFMGGGTTMMEANRMGCAVVGADVNPMAWWIVRQEILGLDVDAYLAEAAELRAHLEHEIGNLYRTRCLRCGSDKAHVKYFLRVKTAKCDGCGEHTDLFPNFLVAENARHPLNVFVCGCCGELFEVADRRNPGPCPHCHKLLPLRQTAKRNKAGCRHCAATVTYSDGRLPGSRLFALEYHCGSCGSQSEAGRGKGRLFKVPDEDDRDRLVQAKERLDGLRTKFIPDDEIPHGDETARLHRWGYRRYEELFNSRQLLGLELSCRWIARIKDQRIREALATNLSDLTRYQNSLCRYDTMALKSLDVFSVHGFPVGLIECESNLLGIAGRGGAPVGSGGWLNIIEKFAKAKRYCSAPFEIRIDGIRKIEVPMREEWIGEYRNGTQPAEQRQVDLRCSDSSSTKLTGERFDAVFTDPPYFGNVQYAELMDFCYVWLRRLMAHDVPEFAKLSTRHLNELTGNVSMGRGLDHFAAGMSQTFQRSVEQLKEGRPLAFTFHHNQLDAYLPLAVAILDAGLVCSGSLPCPAEMGASIHINGTSSSVVDTVFVCRTTGRLPRAWLADDAVGVAAIVAADVKSLAEGGLKATQGDIRCICCGHLTRLAIWELRRHWRKRLPIQQRLDVVRRWFEAFGGLGAVLNEMQAAFDHADQKQRWTPAGRLEEEHQTDNEVSF